LLKQGPTIPSKRTFVCVLFMDIRGFTRLVENKTPEEFVAYQNAVFGAAIEIVDRNHGVINQFLGDGSWRRSARPCHRPRLPERLDQRARASSGVKALSTPGASRRRASASTARWRGSLGNIGSQTRQQYSISGNVVILASRIEQLNKDYDSRSSSRPKCCAKPAKAITAPSRWTWCR